MGMNSMVGVCQQQKNNATPPTPPPATNSMSITFTSMYYGDDSSSGSLIPVNDRLTTTVVAGTNVPDGGVAFLSDSVDRFPIQNAISITYDSSELSDNDLPPDGECKMKITYTNNNGKFGNPISGYNYANGEYYPNDDFPSPPAFVVIGDLNRSQVNGGNTTDTPIIGFNQIEIIESSPVSQGAPTSLEELTFISLPPNRLGEFGFKVQVLLANGTYTDAKEDGVNFTVRSKKRFLISKTTNVTAVTITSIATGVDLGAGQPIDPSQQLVTTVNAGDNVPAGGVAYQFSQNDPSVIQNAIGLAYDTSEITDDDLPADGECAITITVSNNQGFNDNPISSYNYGNGNPYPVKESSASVRIRGLTRAQVNAGSTSLTPVLGVAGFEFTQQTPPQGAPQFTEEFTFQTISPNRTGDVSFAVQVHLANETLTDSAPSTITFVAGSIKPFLIEPETFDLQSITITPQKIVPSEVDIFPQTDLPQGISVPVVLNSGNSFTIPSQSLYYEDLNSIDPNTNAPNRIGHSFEVTFDTSTLTVNNFPEFEVIAQIVVTAPGYDSDFIWRFDGGEEEQTFEWETYERAQIITGGIVSPEIAFPDYTDAPFLTGIDINGLSNLTAKVKILTSSGVFVESNEVTITVSPTGITNIS